MYLAKKFNLVVNFVVDQVECVCDALPNQWFIFDVDNHWLAYSIIILKMYVVFNKPLNITGTYRQILSAIQLSIHPYILFKYIMYSVLVCIQKYN